MSPKAREMTDALLDGIFAQIVEGIAAGRGLDAAAVRTLIDHAGHARGAGGGEARRRHRRSPRRAREGRSEGCERVEAESYMRVDAKSLGLRKGPTIALIFGEGSIVEDGSSFQRVFAADETVKSLDDAAKDDDIRAVVLRINSPGGGAQASDKIWRAVSRVRAKKPVVVSMADYAASGGYYVASGASAIVSEPATLTGSALGPRSRACTRSSRSAARCSNAARTRA